MKIETGQLAGQLGWYVFVDGKLDCDISSSKSEKQAKKEAQKVYPNNKIITSYHPKHYSNLKQGSY